MPETGSPSGGDTLWGTQAHKDFSQQENASMNADGNSCQTTGSSPQESVSIEAHLPPPPVDSDIVRLRALLMNRELVQLDRITQRLDNPSEQVRALSSVVAEALAMRSLRDKSLHAALTPVVEDVLRILLRKRPQDIINIFFPIIGATIRRAVSESIRSLLEGLNTSLELSFSLKGLRWRLEALRSGKSFSEIVLLHTLLYRVEQVFLIHSETGLVLAHVVGEGVEAQDADMVSAMLTAIQDFVRDCFARGEGGQLDSLRLDDFTILVERAPNAYLFSPYE